MLLCHGNALCEAGKQGSLRNFALLRSVLAWPAAFVLGAIVAPSDAVATTAVTRELNVRRAITTVLDGESLMNDAVAFVAYRYAVAARA